jgi:transcriptional regulator with XRE-family HTH domain
METRKVTAYKISKTIGCSNSSVANWRAGTVTPDSENVRKLADFFDVPMAFFLDKEPVLSSSERLSFLMLVQGVSIEQVANAANVAVETVRSWIEQGVSYDAYAGALSNLLNVSADYLLRNINMPRGSSDITEDEAYLINVYRFQDKEPRYFGALADFFPEYAEALSLSDSAVDIAARYDALCEDGRALVRAALINAEDRFASNKERFKGVEGDDNELSAENVM